jgi:hypothetical protein
MSSTNRGSVRNASDYYRTPVSAIELFLLEWAKDEPKLREVRHVFDPCAGGRIEQGKIIEHMPYVIACQCSSVFADDFENHIETMDIRGDSPADIVRDYLDSQPAKTPDLILSNPPFALAMEFIQKALQDVKPGGFVVFLLRLNFFETAKRKAFMQSTPPYRAYVHSERMSFTADGKQDSIAYCHMVWQSGRNNKDTILRVI